MWCAENWKDYALLDCSDGQRLERWGSFVLIRPDPQDLRQRRLEVIDLLGTVSP